MKSRLIILWALFMSVLLPISVRGAKPGDTIRGSVGNYSDLSPDQRAALQENATLAKAAYSDGAIPSGYRAATRAEFNKYIGLTSQKNIQYDPQSGHFKTIGVKSDNDLAGSFLINEKDGSFVLAFRGTDSIKDGKIDIYQGIGGIPEQYKEAAEMLENLVSNTETEKIPIKVVGHSLGGALAAYSTLECSDVSRVTTTTFNTAGLYPTNIEKSHLADAAPKITNIRVDEDVVSKTGLLIGNTYNLGSGNMMADAITDGSREGARVGGLIGSTGGAIGGTTAGVISVHSMDTVIKLMREASSQSQPEIPNSPNEDDNMCRAQDDNEPAGDDSVTTSGNVGSSPSGDATVDTGSGNDSANGDLTKTAPDGDDGGMCYAPKDDNAVETDATQYPNDNSESWGNDVGSGSIPDARNMFSGLTGDNLPDFGSLMNDFADNAAIVGPNFPHYRMLWLFSGESLADEASSIISNPLSIFNNMGGYLSEMKEALQTITGIGN